MKIENWGRFYFLAIISLIRTVPNFCFQFKSNRDKIKNLMMPSAPPEFFTIPRLEKIPFLYHGFGTVNWREKDFYRREEWKNFRLVFLEQIHSNVVHFVEMAGNKKYEGDGLITSLPFLFLIIKSADCLAILLVEESRKVIAAVHCGWRGTRRRVVERVVQNLKDNYGCSPSSLLVAMGPSIGGKCYEVGEDVIIRFREEGVSAEFFQPHPHLRGKYFLDLKKANLSQLISQGVRAENVFSLDICTHCQDIFPSYRRDGQRAGRMLSFIGMEF